MSGRARTEAGSTQARGVWHTMTMPLTYSMYVFQLGEPVLGIWGRRGGSA